MAQSDFYFTYIALLAVWRLDCKGQRVDLRRATRRLLEWSRHEMMKYWFKLAKVKMKKYIAEIFRMYGQQDLGFDFLMILKRWGIKITGVVYTHTHMPRLALDLNQNGQG